MQALLNYISGLNIPGAVLIFLPGWNLIFALHKHLKMHPQFGKTKSDPRLIYCHIVRCLEERKLSTGHVLCTKKLYIQSLKF